MRVYLSTALIAIILASCNSGEKRTITTVRESVAQIVEYCPAPGQFINSTESGTDAILTPAEACEYASQRLSTNTYVSLGGWGGYITARFAQSVPSTGDYDIYVMGNQMPLSSEAGIVWVAQSDASGNPKEWFELKGSEWENPQTVRGYEITYKKPIANGQDIEWSDNQGGSGTIEYNRHHTQDSYYPQWIADTELIFSGTRLPENYQAGDIEGESAISPMPFAWGYADNYSSIDREGAINRFRISDAVDSSGESVDLEYIDFIRVQTAVNACKAEIGENSTEVCSLGCYRVVEVVE